jgi:putative spermidine/putrescine transport system substrate-binding protein
MRARLLALLGVLSLLLAACGTPSSPAPTSSSTAPTTAPAPPEAATDDPAALPWDQVLAAARGTTVSMFMWGGDDAINRYMDEFIAPRLKSEYDVTLKRTPLSDTAEAVNKVLGEKTAAADRPGSIDLIWINGENFRTMRQGELLYGPWAQQLPNAALIPWEEPGVANDFGFPVEGYEAPWGRAQFVLIYDSARVPEPPRSFAALLEWVQANPGRFTYPAPPDFTGSVFVRHGFYEAAGGYQDLLGDFDEQTYAAKAPAAWELFNQLAPYLWRNGETYPQDIAQLDQLFANGEVDFTMSYNPSHASGQVEKGVFPPTTRTYLLEAGTIANTHYLAIPFNAPNKAGAMVLANLLESPEAQVEKAKPAVWGDMPVVDVARLPDESRAALDAIPRGVATLPLEELAANAQPELQAEWLERIEKDWIALVLKQ